MGVVVESEAWEPSSSAFVFIFISCFLSLFLYPHFSRNDSSSSSLDHGSSSPSLARFRSKFLFIYSLASVMEGLWSVFGEFELAYYGVSREEMILSLCAGCAGALILGSFIGLLSDLIGHKRLCVFFCVLHLFVGVWKRITIHPSVWVASICLSIATSVYSFSFETWMVLDHEKRGFREDTLNDTFWLMTFFESVSLIGSQVLANYIIGGDLDKSIVSFSTAIKVLAVVAMFVICKGCEENSQDMSFREYRMCFRTYIFGDKRILLLVCAQSCLHFSTAVFWILWAPTLVADGRELNLGLVLPCLLGARILGSTIYPWLVSGPSSFRAEDCVQYAFIVMGLVLFIIAYDYQEIEFLVSLFCLFHACDGLLAPFLARLRTMYVPNQLRGGMISLSLVPANAAVLFVLLQVSFMKAIVFPCYN
uniref:Molybdate-anion transporter-like n=1 Tax=Kalanchoe fedtschenkoi TaxID=63787 RepID=A0A7N0T535_KALFE